MDRGEVDRDEARWAALMRVANGGDDDAYREVLTAIAAHVRGVVRRRAGAMGGLVDIEDVVQETLIAIHLKRRTWDETQPIGPWIRAIARYKLVDAFRRRGRQVAVPIDDVADALAVDEPDHGRGGAALDRMVSTLPGRQRDIVQAIAREGRSVKEVAARLAMSEVAVRVALHRAVRRLARTFGGER